MRYEISESELICALIVAVSIMSEASTTSNCDEWELMHYIHKVSSHLPPLEGVEVSDTIDTGLQ